jgi:hypothetical protein
MRWVYLAVIIVLTVSFLGLSISARVAFAILPSMFCVLLQVAPYLPSCDKLYRWSQIGREIGHAAGPHDEIPPRHG